MTAVQDFFDDINALMAGPEPDYETDPTPEPAADIAKANALLRTLGARQRELAAWEEMYDAERQKLDEWIASRRERVGGRIAWLETWLANWHRAQLGEHGNGPKTISLPSGTLAARAQQPEFRFDPEAFIPWAEANAPELLRHKPAPAPEIDKAAAKKHLAATGEAMPGVEVVERGPRFTATPET